MHQYVFFVYLSGPEACLASRPSALNTIVLFREFFYRSTTVVSLDEPTFDPDEFSHIGKTYQGVEPHRMGGHSVVQNPKNPQSCVHQFDPNYRDYFIVQLAHRTQLQTLCVSTQFFAGNPDSDLMVTLIDDLFHQECRIPMSSLQPDAEHWLDGLDFQTTRIAFHFKAGGITRVWAFGNKAEIQPKALTWLAKDSTVVFKEDDFFGGPDFALSQQADRSTPHMLGWETSRSAMGLQAVFPIQQGMVREIHIDTYRHVNNYLRSAWVFSANLPPGTVLTKSDCPHWQVISSEGQETNTDDLKTFFAEQHQGRSDLPTYQIAPISRGECQLQTTFSLTQDALHVQSGFDFTATHICIMLLPHGRLHAIRVMGDVV